MMLGLGIIKQKFGFCTRSLSFSAAKLRLFFHSHKKAQNGLIVTKR